MRAHAACGEYLDVGVKRHLEQLFRYIIDPVIDHPSDTTPVRHLDQIFFLLKERLTAKLKLFVSIIPY